MEKKTVGMSCWFHSVEDENAWHNVLTQLDQGFRVKIQHNMTKEYGAKLYDAMRHAGFKCEFDPNHLCYIVEIKP